MELVLATRNAHKLAEVAPHARAVRSHGRAAAARRSMLPPEDGDTLRRQRADQGAHRRAALGRPVIADDSGIEAAALDGRPGVRSARFAGEHATDAENLDKLIAEAPAGSELRYVCALAFVDGVARAGVLRRVPRACWRPARAASAASATTRCSCPTRPRARTMAELTDAEKDPISHRGEALREFAQWYRAGRGDR